MPIPPYHFGVPFGARLESFFVLSEFFFCVASGVAPGPHFDDFWLHFGVHLGSISTYFEHLFGDPLILWFLQPLPHDSLVFECFYRVGFQTPFLTVYYRLWVTFGLHLGY